MPTPSIDRVRKSIAASVGPDRLKQVSDTDLLVEGGIISSLEIVMIGLELEKEFGAAVPDSALTVANFKSIEMLVALMDRLTGSSGEGAVQGGGEHGTYRALQDSLANCFRRPLILGLLVASWLFLLDSFALPYLVERGPRANSYALFADHGKRLYHSSGGWAPNDLRVAVKRHQLVKNRNTGAPSILFFGDSGTIGSWVRAEDAPPAKVEERLRATYPEAKVYNFGFFMRSFVKLLEENEGRFPADAAIFTLSDGYFDSAFQRSLIDAMPYFSLNRGLLARFKERANTSIPAAYDHLHEYLAMSNRKHRGQFEEHFLERTSIYRYKTYLTFLTLNGRNPGAFWLKEYAIGDKPLLPTRLPGPPAGFQLHDAGFNAATIDRDAIVLVGDVLDFLTARGIKVYLFLRPYAPLEWRDHPFATREANIADLIRDQGWNKKATVIDLRWSLYGDQFSDSLSHYTPAGSRVLGDAIGGAIAATLSPPSAVSSGSRQ
jgi:acyl carrier protein